MLTLFNVGKMPKVNKFCCGTHSPIFTGLTYMYIKLLIFVWTLKNGFFFFFLIRLTYFSQEKKNIFIFPKKIDNSCIAVKHAYSSFNTNMFTLLCRRYMYIVILNI